MSKTCLTILAHPDDCEINCAGTLILLANKGWGIHIATCSTGDCGSAVLQPNVIGSTRRLEAQKAAQLIGGTYHCLGGTDLHIFDDDFMRGAATALIRKVNPDFVITHFPEDYMPDHTAASAITRCATFTAPIINYVQSDSAGYPATDKIVPIYYVRPMEGVDWLGFKQKPHFYVDISSVVEKKAEMLACHSSQREWLRKHHGMDQYIEQMKTWDKEWGAKAGVCCAEPFFIHKGHAYPKTGHLLDELSEYIKLA